MFYFVCRLQPSEFFTSIKAADAEFKGKKSASIYFKFSTLIKYNSSQFLFSLYYEDVWVNGRRAVLHYPDHPSLVQLEQFSFASFGLFLTPRVVKQLFASMLEIFRKVFSVNMIIF